MKIKYVHFSEPKKVKIYDTEIALKKNSFYRMSQEKFDELELKHMEECKANGRILSYEILQ